MKHLTLIPTILACSLMTCGCFYYPVYSSSSSVSNDVALEDSGENPSTSFGLECPANMKTLEEGDRIKTDILDIEINSAGFYETFEGNYPGDEGWRFLVVNITAESRFQDTAVLYIDPGQFLITWDALDGYAITPEADLYVTNQLADYKNEIRFFKNSSRTGNIIFVVPKDVEGLKFIYQNYALPFTGEEESDPYDDYYSDYYSDDPYYDNTPYYDFSFDWYDFFGGYGDDENGEEMEPSDLSL